MLVPGKVFGLDLYSGVTAGAKTNTGSCCAERIKAEATAWNRRKTDHQVPGACTHNKLGKEREDRRLVAVTISLSMSRNWVTEYLGSHRAAMW